MKKRPVVKLTYLPFDKETQVVMIDEFEGFVLNYNNIEFTINITPPEPEPEATHGSVRKELVYHIKYLEKVVHLMNILGSKTQVGGSFYWSEGDLLLELSIPTWHPLVKHLFNKPKKN